MKRWPKVALGELLKPSAVPVRVDRDLHYPNFGIYSYGRGLFAKPAISGMQTSAGTLYRVRAGDFIYSRLFAWEGSFGVVDERFDNCFVSNEYPCFAIDSSRIDRRFLKAYFQYPRTWQAVGQGSKGVGSRRIRVQPDKVLAHAIALPSLTEQEAIVARLDALETRVRQVAEQLDAADTIGASLLLSLHHKLARDRVIRLAEVLELYEEEEIITPTTRYPQVGVRGFGGGLFPKMAVGGNETSYRSFNRLYEGAIVLSQVKGWEGAIARCPRELDGWFVSPEYRTFRCIAGAGSDKYLGAIMATEWFWSKLQDATRGVGARRERTRPEQFLQIELPLPELQEQEQILRILQRQEPLKLKHTAIRTANAALIPATLERIFADAD